MAEFRWSEERKAAAQLIADGELTDSQIGDKVGVTRWTIWDWRRSPEFMEVVEDLRQRMLESLKRRAISHAEVRVARLNKDWLKLQRVFEARATAPEMQDVPGGETGLLVRNVKGVGQGDKFQLVDVYEVDTASLKELREMEQQAAKELGQWVERNASEVTTKTYSVENPPEDV